MRAMADHIPVTVLTGFLGSGKTTVLNHLLRQPALNGVVAIINEFGEVALDHLLVETSEDRLALLDNGCICCSVREDLIETLRRILLRVAPPGRSRRSIVCCWRLPVSPTPCRCCTP